MNRNFIFVLILLVTLSMVNAIPTLHKRTTSYTKCPEDQVPPNTVELTVTIQPDPPVPGKNDSFTISGKLTEEINDKIILAFNFADADGNILADTFITPVCTEKVKCPIQPNTEFKSTVDVPVPSSLAPDSFINAVLIGTDQLADIYGCAVHLTNSAAADSISYTFLG